MSLEGKVALVTGSTSGIGLGIARAMAEAGAHVMLNGFGDPGAIEHLRSEIAGTFNVRTGYHGADMSRPAEVAALVRQTVEQLGRLDILVNNAGILRDKAFNKSAYVAAKHGLVGLTKVGAIELANDGVTVNAICPGWVLTPLVEAQLQDRAARESAPVEEVKLRLLAEKQPMTQFTTPAGIGGLAVFLCSDAARTITGASLSIDGGWVAT